MAPIQRTQLAVEVLCDAFAEDPPMRWLYPGSPAERRAGVGRLFGPAVAAAAEAGTLACTESAAAVWLPVAAGQHLGVPPEIVVPERVRLLTEVLAQRHPADRAHLYLAFLGVRLGSQGLGLGGGLLAEGLRRAEAAGLPTYLEASSIRNLPLYERHGFRCTGDPIELPDGPTLWPMWRDNEEN